MRFIVILIMGFGLTACGEADNRSAEEMQQAELRAQLFTPAGATLAEKYDRSCRGCHTVLATGAPLTGDNISWGPRLQQGEATLLNNTLAGTGGMPPLGMCPDCTVEEFSALIEFMSAPIGDH